MARRWSPAARRYGRRLAALMTVYVLALFAAVWLFKHGLVSGPAAWTLAIAPALPIIGVFWAVMRFIIEETDEFIRLLIVRQCMVATGFCLTVMTVWEFLQNFELVPPGNGGFGAAFFWFIGLGVGALYNKLTMGTAGSCA
ncbi:hypothetical protein G6N82_08075 [Altererythrobacter sp. BO-6]|uniref:hypothetical protein n=1 Tax=Altererythrobacter sp. BO-6 TaxID=2604537 RepID=UPI0013E1E086|nr:hypothetical protein [Altererythrobacter sp. BO-6]QIG54112.1 hypothetical protein G6N82_08075 [Altererythrobacter sp. BO-6]